MRQSLHQWFAYIEGLHVQAIALGLDRVRAVAQELNVLVFACPVITIAGTNGKGSCVTLLESILTAANYRVGAYTSPHLLRFHERIRVCAQEVDNALLVEAFEQVEVARAGVALTFFEFTTLAALYLFKLAQPDVIILEVGLGGRLDAVNILDADVAVITSIALDHTELLGETREAIGYEKAGIFRPKCAAVCGDPDPPETLLNVAQAMDTQLYCVGREFKFGFVADAGDSDQMPLAAKKWYWETLQCRYGDLPSTSLPLENAATALMAIDCLQSRLPVNVLAIQQGLARAFLPGRFQWFYKPLPIVLDVAHNPASARYLAKRLAAFPLSGKTHAVVSVLADKDILATLKPLLAVVNIWHVAPLNLSRGLSAARMASYLQELGMAAYDVRLADSVMSAFQQALQECQSQDRIVVFGSFYTVAPVLQCLAAGAEENVAHCLIP